jgi:hypothetical protein
MTGVERAVEPVDGEIAATVGARGAANNGGVGPDGDDRSSQAANPIAHANSNTPWWVLFVMACSSVSLLSMKRETTPTG